MDKTQALWNFAYGALEPIYGALDSLVIAEQVTKLASGQEIPYQMQPLANTLIQDFERIWLQQKASIL